MLNHLIRVLVAMALLLPCGIHAATIQLPRTGQTGCWDTSGNVVACTNTGQDGEKLTGAVWPSPRFTDNANGTLTDNLTGLVWLKDANCFGTTTWQQALDASNALANGTCNLTDTSTAGQWRLPNRKEMLSATSYQATDGDVWFNSQGFTNGIHGWYWSSTTYVANPADKWVIHTVGDAWPASIAGAAAYSVLPVRNTIAIATVSPTAGDFGSIAPDQSSATQAFTISNTGIDSLVLTGISLTGTDSAAFAVSPGDGTNGTCGSLTPTIAAGSNCKVSVIFTPTSVGAKSATLLISSNDLTSPNQNIALTGTGTATGATFTATGATGGNGTITSANPVSVSSGATAAFTLAPATGYQASAAVTGTCPAGSFSGNIYTTGAITADCTVNFAFTPITVGTYSILDAVKAYKYALGKAQLTDSEKTHCDVAPLGADAKPQPDGVVDVADVVIMLRRLVGIINW